MKINAKLFLSWINIWLNTLIITEVEINIHEAIAQSAGAVGYTDSSSAER